MDGNNNVQVFLAASIIIVHRMVTLVDTVSPPSVSPKLQLLIHEGRKHLALNHVEVCVDLKKRHQTEFVSAQPLNGYFWKLPHRAPVIILEALHVLNLNC